MTDDDPPGGGDPMGISPTRRERRGATPDHPPEPVIAPGPVLLDVAKRLARQRLNDWKAAHPNV